MADRAAALTYYMMMSLFPALLVGISLLGLLGDSSLVADAVEYARENGAPAAVTDALEALLTKTVSATGGAVSGALVLGLVIAVYGAAGAFGAAGRALNHIYGVKDSRGFVTHKLADIGYTLLVIALAIVALVSVFLGGDLAGDVFGTIGLGDTAASVWRVVRWAVAVGAVLGIYAIVFSLAPDIGARWRGSSAWARSSASGSGSSRRPASGSTSRTSAASARRTAPSPARSSCCSGCTSRASRSCSAPSSTA